jgi:hypothetical protein
MDHGAEISNTLHVPQMIIVIVIMHYYWEDGRSPGDLEPLIHRYLGYVPVNDHFS